MGKAAAVKTPSLMVIFGSVPLHQHVRRAQVSLGGERPGMKELGHPLIVPYLFPHISTHSLKACVD